MTNNKQPKVFAFRLAAQQQPKKQQKKPTRHGVTVAGCSGPDMRADDWFWGRDNGIWC